MVRTPSEVSNDIVNHLHLLDPEMSAQIGSPERKIIDAVASVISASYIQSQLTSSIWDIDTKAGVELEEVCGLFGFGRRSGTKANGVLAITLQEPAPSDYVIPAGTIASTLSTDITPAVQYFTIVPVVITAGTSYAEVPAESTETGVLGNTAAQTIVVLETWTSVASVYNPNAFSNGTNAETDEELRARFKNTFLRNLAGTEDFYASLCLNHKNVTKVRILGPVERHVEQLEALKNQAGQLVLNSGIMNSKFAWPKGVIVSSSLGLDDEIYYTDGQQYSVNYDTPQITVLCEQVDEANDPDRSFIHEGDIVNLEHEYTSIASRNDPAAGITNAVDIFVNGAESTNISEHSIVNLKQLNSPGLVSRNFYDDYGNLLTTGRLHILGYGPVVALPPSFTVDDELYEMQTASDAKDYRLVREVSVYSGSTQAIQGILFTGSRYPANGKFLDIVYSYNRVPMLLDELLKYNKQITTDVIVHEADIVPIGLNVVIQMNRGYSLETVRADIIKNLTDWMNTIGFGEWIQFSDIHNVIRMSAGVDNARMKKASDNDGAFGMQTYSRNGRFAKATHTADFQLLDNQLPVFNRIGITVRAENTFGE